MSEFLRFVFIGLGVGAIYALAAQGIVLVYRGSGVLNFAHGAIALVAASVFVSVRPAVPAPVAAGAGIVVAMLLGAAMERLVIRPLRTASPIVRLIATLGVLTVLSGAVRLRYGDNPRFTPPVLPAEGWTLPGEIPVSSDRIWLVGIVTSLTLVLWLTYSRTGFGRATVAVAENERATAALGWSPDRVSSINWIAGAGLAGLAGVLFAPITSVSATTLTLLVIPALAAALVGSFRSFPVTLAGGLLIGTAEAVLTRYVSTPGWSSVVPLLIIVAVLVVRGSALPLRSHVADRLPRVGTGAISTPGLLTAIVVGFGGLSIFTESYADAMISSAAVGVIIVSLVVVTGYAGQLSIAQYALAGIGALLSSRLADAWGWPFPLAAAAGVVLTIPVALLVAVPALRARGVNLAIATLGLSLAIEKLILANPDYTGGPIRGTVVPSPEIFGWSVDSVKHPERYASISLLVLLVTGLVGANVRRGRTGRQLLAVRSNERAAAALGIGVFASKLYAFALAGAIAAAGGVLLAFRNEHVLFDQFQVLRSIDVVLFTVIGGLGFVSAAPIGALLAPGGVSDNIVGHLIDPNRWVTFIAACLVVVMIIPRPDGVGQQASLIVAWLRSRRRKQTALVPLPEPDRSRVTPRRLEVDGLSVDFGPVRAVDDVSLVLEPATVVGLIGPNGAGKTTFIDAVTGFVPSTGTVRCDGTDVGRWSPRRRAGAGVSRSFQSLELFEEMTVLDNLRVASDRTTRWTYLTDLFRPGNQPLGAVAVAAVREFDLEEDLHRLPSELSYGRRRLVALARAVAQRPSILFLDEPAAGLDGREADELAHLIRRLADDWGIAVLLVEHDVDLVMRVCDHIVALDFGKVIGRGTPAEVRAAPAVVAAYLGQDSSATDDRQAEEVAT